MRSIKTEKLELRKRVPKTREVLMASICSIVFSAGQVAIAQDDTTEEVGGAGGSVMDTVIVTSVGTKTDADIFEIPQSVSTVDSETFLDQGAVNFQDIFRYSVGVQSETEGVDTRGDFFNARGFGTQQFLDGLSRMPDFVYGARMEVFTIDKAEILRGPSGVLYGSGAPGGIFNAVSKTPNFDFGGEVGVSVGNFERKEIRADVGGGITDTIAARIVGVARDGELQVPGQDDDRVVVMPSITWQPTDSTDITFLTLYQKDDLGTQTYLPLARTDAAPEGKKLPIDFFIGEEGFNHMDMEHKSATLMINHEFSDTISISNSTRIYTQETDYAEVYGYGALGGVNQSEFTRYYYTLDETYQVFNTDTHASFELSTGPFVHNILVGVDYQSFEQDRAEGYGAGPAALDLDNPVYGIPFDTAIANAYDTLSTQTGLYIQDQIDYGERASLVFAVRRDHSTSKISGVSEDPKNATTIKVGGIVDIGFGMSPYVSYAEGFQPTFGGDFYGNPYEPQESSQYEAGLKWQVNHNSLVTLAYFDIEETNFLVQDPNEIQNFLQSGKIGSKGFELEGSTTLFDSFDITAAYAYTDAEVLVATDGTQGLDVPNIPKHLASIWGVQTFSFDDWSLRVGGGIRHTGEKTDTYNIYETEGVTLVDGIIEAAYDDWSLSVNINNLLDKEYYAYCGIYADPLGTCYPGMTRRVTATVSRKF
ncbi:TonB-dependent siderophore receptor [Hirschia baltica]|uniref:TonB-dependent siderophore receptor n=1 Tax=Hirschia baltica (strain ATCC 49814 / DSM 5838 / IFAM 1418) TaxID=582402 RepID=C6XP67_HIRBI|nr:TonB-dependent siderophore receptor [Hirschia baltica]ACT60247.1 TonB-dependent siderophore receptor [Hirschia baltica ATCC 49814]